MWRCVSTEGEVWGLGYEEWNFGREVLGEAGQEEGGEMYIKSDEEGEQ